MAERTSSESKKLTLFYLQELFLEKTDATHYVRMPEIKKYLADRDIIVDRRTVYTDLKLLDYAGFEIVGVQEKGGYKYHHPSRTFSTNELKFLIDAIGVSRFLTDKKATELIAKVKELGSANERQSLNRHAVVGQRIKSMSDIVLKNLDKINEAISDNCKISFQYMRWTPEKTIELMNDGKDYVVSPFAVTLANDYYYLLAYDGEREEIHHYRVDKMKKISFLDEDREGKELYKAFNISDYSMKVFNMFHGKEETVSFEITRSLANVFIDRFGDTLSIRKNFDNPNTYIARATVMISPQFYAWVFGLGSSVKIISPKQVQSGFVDYLKKVERRYPSEIENSV